MATRKLEILACNVGYQGSNAKGPFTIYNIEAKDPETGVMVSQKLNSFTELPLGLGEYKVEKYEKNGNISYTLSKPGGRGGGSSLGPKVDELRGRVEMLEQNMETMRSNVANLMQMVERMAQGQPVAASPPPPPQDTGGGAFGDEDDVPFLHDGFPDYGERRGYW